MVSPFLWEDSATCAVYLSTDRKLLGCYSNKENFILSIIFALSTAGQF